MSKIAFIFPGQGAQYVGMGKDLAASFPVARQAYTEADLALEENLSDLCFNGPEEELTLTENTQPAILATSIAAYRVLAEAGITPDVTAGLSLGEYAALVVAGVMTFQDAIRLVRLRGRFMQEAVPSGQGKMAAIIGLEREAVIDICSQAQTEGLVTPANFNCPGQIVIAGEAKAVEEAVELATSAGAKRAILLTVSAPFHCALLEPAGAKLQQELEKVEFSHPKLPVVANVTADYVNSASEIKNLLVRQVNNPVLWEDSVCRMIADGVNTFIEIGPGKSLSGFMRRIDKSLASYNIQNENDITKLLAIL